MKYIISTLDALQSAVASNQLDSNIPVHVYSDDDSSIPTKYLSKTVIQCRSKIAAASIVEPIASSPIDLQTSIHSNSISNDRYFEVFCVIFTHRVQRVCQKRPL